MTRRYPTVEAAYDEARKLGATFTYHRGTKHFIGVIHFNGHQRKTSLSSTPADHRVLHKVRKFVRKAIAEMSALPTAKTEEQA